MSIYTLINGHRIAVPADMVAMQETRRFAGAYDYIAYKDREICTFEPTDAQHHARLDKALALVTRLAGIGTQEACPLRTQQEANGKWSVYQGGGYRTGFFDREDEAKGWIAGNAADYEPDGLPPIVDLAEAVAAAEAILAYTGPFAITTGAGEGIEADTLDHIRAIIDRGTDKSVGADAGHFWSWFDKKVEEAEATVDGKACKAAGFQVQHTGGGFVAWMMEVTAPFSGRYSVNITDDDGTALFDATEWYVSTINDDGQYFNPDPDGPMLCPTVQHAITEAMRRRDGLLAERLIHPAEVYSYDWPDGDPRHGKTGRMIPNPVFQEIEREGVGFIASSWVAAPREAATDEAWLKRACQITLINEAGAYGIEVEEVMRVEAV